MWNANAFDNAILRLPALFSTEGVEAADKMILVHLFVGSADWYICEADLNNNELFGFACLGDWDMAEWGYISIAELKELRLKSKMIDHATGRELTSTTRSIEVDYDLHWKPCRFADIPKVKENLYN